MGVIMTDEIVLPFVLAYVSETDVNSELENVKEKLTERNFEIVGVADPSDSIRIVCFTSEILKERAASKKLGGFASCLRVAITQTQSGVEVSWTNPKYLGAICRVQEKYDDTYDELVTAIGKQEEFGAKQPLTDAKARKYHYKIGMPYFNEPIVLAKYSSHEEACQALEKNLASNSLHCKQIFKIPLKNNETMYGVQIDGGEFPDSFVMKKIDVKAPYHTAHLPYEIAVVDSNIIAHSPKFRIAIHFTDLKMVGNNSFASIMECPKFYEKTFKKLSRA